MTAYAVICAALLIVFCVLLIVSDYGKKPKLRYLFKTLASIMFIAIGSAMFLRGDVRVTEGLPVWIGLCFSLLGDVFLALFDHRRQERYFAIGVLWFGLAQISYSVYFITAGPWTAWSILIAAALAAFTLVSARVFHMKLDKSMTVLVGIYSFLLSLAFASGFIRMVFLPNPRTRIMAAGMALFLLSDIVLLFKYFYGKPPKCLTAVNLTTYYGAQLLLALGIGIF